MQFYKLTLALLTFVATALAVDPPKDLVIDVVEKPESCKLAAGSGDRVSVHYVRSGRL